MEQERYFDTIVKLTPTKMPFSADLGDGDEPESIDITPLSVRKTTHSTTGSYMIVHEQVNLKIFLIVKMKILQMLD
jgi:hypothetical protein